MTLCLVSKYKELVSMDFVAETHWNLVWNYFSLFWSSLRDFCALLWSYFSFEIILKAYTSLADFYTWTFAKFILEKEQGAEVSALRVICNNSNVMEKSNCISDDCHWPMTVNAWS